MLSLLLAVSAGHQNGNRLGDLLLVAWNKTFAPLVSQCAADYTAAEIDTAQPESAYRENHDEQ